MQVVVPKREYRQEQPCGNRHGFDSETAKAPDDDPYFRPRRPPDRGLPRGPRARSRGARAPLRSGGRGRSPGVAQATAFQRRIRSSRREPGAGTERRSSGPVARNARLFRLPLGHGRHRGLPHPPGHPGGRPPAPLPSVAELLAGLPQETLVVGLVGLANHDNVGGIFRNAAAFGAGRSCSILQVRDPLYRKAIRVSVGGALVVPFTRVSSAAVMVSAARIGLRGDLPDPIRTETLARSALHAGRPCSSAPKVRPARLPCSRRPAPSRFPERRLRFLNVATTSGIALHHLSEAGLGADVRTGDR